MTHLKKYWIWYLVAAVVVTIAILAYFNWDTVKGWFASDTDDERGMSMSDIVTFRGVKYKCKKNGDQILCAATGQ